MGHAANFLYMLFGQRPNPTAIRAMDIALTLHADHELNASTFAARVAAATLTDIHSAIVAGIGTLKGPLHGGANAEVMKMLIEIGQDAPAERIDAYVKGKLARKEKISGFGHRVYNTEDPRATHLRQMSKELGQKAGNTRWFEMSRADRGAGQGREEAVSRTSTSTRRRRTTRWASPIDLYTPIFAVSRISGWTAHVLEQLAEQPPDSPARGLHRPDLPADLDSARTAVESPARAGGIMDRILSLPRRSRVAAAAGAVALALAIHTSAHSQEFGSITFPTSGAPGRAGGVPRRRQGAAQLRVRRRRGRLPARAEGRPGFRAGLLGRGDEPQPSAVGAAGPRRGEGDPREARPDRDGALAKAKLPKEKAFLEAMHVLYYGPGDKLARDIAYSEAMARMYEQWPDDHEIATFYALSLLGTVRPGDTGFRRQALRRVDRREGLPENPKHPGAAHFIIHSFDDPDHAPLALTAARAYAKIAPSAAHALHMPSHIFVQRGMWEDVAQVEHRGLQGGRRSQRAA